MTRLIAVDVDNTIADYTRGLADWLTRHYPNQTGPMPDPDVYDLDHATGWRFPFGYRHAHASAVHDGLYHGLSAYPGVTDTFTRLRDHDWRIIIMTSRPEARAAADTRRWLRRHHIPYDGLYLGDKTLLDVDILVDDDPMLLDRVAHTHPHTMLLHPDHSYCRHAAGGTVDWTSPTWPYDY